MKLITKIPSDHTIQQDIRHMYYLQCEDEEINYTFYPSNSIVLMIYLSTDIKQTKAKTILFGNNSGAVTQLIAGPLAKMKEIKYSGIVKMFGVSFEGYGIYNYSNFNQYHLNEKMISNDQSFSDLVNEKSLFLLPPDEALSLIQDYFIQNKTPYEEQILDKCLSLIAHDSSITLSELSKSVNTSKKTIIKKFSKYLGRTPSNYLSVKKLRASLTKNSRSFTEMAYELGFCDQSHMIKSFKKLSDETPSSIRKKNNISHFDQIQWLQ